MFNFAWSEIAVIVAVALVLIGPKDMPVAVRAITGAIRKARGMAAEFRGHVDEMMREANLDEVRETLNEFRNFDVAGAAERMVDPDGSLRGTFADDPLAEAETVGELAVAELDPAAEAEPAAPAEAPAFIPPAFILPAAAMPADGIVPAEAAPRSGVPAFVPPEFAARAAR
ncbi:MAG: twin-arginine translocase subunit TatB [Rhodospirillales bacterium]|nr:twin-arginine translocase subunit TatB [Rhodospirillales bacterium]